MAIELKNKLVTLEDLRAAHDDLVSKISGGAKVWHDITNELTWQTGKAPVLSQVFVDLDPKWQWQWKTVTSSDGDIYRLQHAEITPAHGERYRITGWQTNMLYVFLDASDNLMDYGGDPQKEGHEEGIDTSYKQSYGLYRYGTVELTVPKTAAKLMVLNYNKVINNAYSLTDIIVEKEA